ncbi:hypothetical protein HN51_040365 [Arachis hypogaea]
MGREKTIYECIQNERKRKISFMQRKDEIMKKISTFLKLCKVETYLIVQSIIERYETQKNNETHPMIFDGEEFFEIKKIMNEA